MDSVAARFEILRRRHLAPDGTACGQPSTASASGTIIAAAASSVAADSAAKGVGGQRRVTTAPTA